MESVIQNTNDSPVKKGHAAKKLLLICLRKIFIGDDDLIAFMEKYYSKYSGWTRQSYFTIIAVPELSGIGVNPILYWVQKSTTACLAPL